MAATSWLGTQLLLDTISKMSGTIDAKSVLAAFNKLGDYDGQGLIGNFSFATEAPVPGATREFNRTYIVYTIENGIAKLLPSGTAFLDATDGLNS